MQLRLKTETEPETETDTSTVQLQLQLRQKQKLRKRETENGKLKAEQNWQTLPEGGEGAGKKAIDLNAKLSPSIFLNGVALLLSLSDGII